MRLKFLFVFSSSQKRTEGNISSRDLKNLQEPLRLKSNQSSPYRYSIAPLRTMKRPNRSKAKRVLSSISFEIFSTNEATMSPTPKALIASEKYLFSRSIFKKF